MMSETTNEDRMYPIEMTLQGARCCISIGKGVIKALGKPSHVSIKISDSHDSLSVFPCDEDDVMAFRVPLKLFTDHRCVMRINSKQFVHGIMRTNQMDTSKTYVLSGEFLEEKNTAVFSLVEGVSLRTQKGMAQSRTISSESFLRISLNYSGDMNATRHDISCSFRRTTIQLALTLELIRMS